MTDVVKYDIIVILAGVDESSLRDATPTRTSNNPKATQIKRTSPQAFFLFNLHSSHTHIFRIIWTYPRSLSIIHLPVVVHTPFVAHQVSVLQIPRRQDLERRKERQELFALPLRDS